MLAIGGIAASTIMHPSGNLPYTRRDPELHRGDGLMRWILGQVVLALLVVTPASHGLRKGLLG